MQDSFLFLSSTKSRRGRRKQKMMVAPLASVNNANVPINPHRLLFCEGAANSSVFLKSFHEPFFLLSDGGAPAGNRNDRSDRTSSAFLPPAACYGSLLSWPTLSNATSTQHFNLPHAHGSVNARTANRTNDRPDTRILDTGQRARVTLHPHYADVKIAWTAR